MNKKTNLAFKKIHKDLKKTRPFSFYMILSMMFVFITITAIGFYIDGKQAGYTQKESELKQLEQEQIKQELIKQDLADVKEHFYKFLMIQVMFWFKWIILSLLVGWILHGIF